MLLSLKQAEWVTRRFMAAQILLSNDCFNTTSCCGGFTM
jgi:hypothetical protein